MHCTIPSLLGFRTWFEKRFSDLCEEHDAHYVRRDVPKTWADVKVAYKIARRDVKYIPLGVGALVALLVLPRAYTIWYKDETGRWVW
jgi:hypothetical protein